MIRTTRTTPNTLSGNIDTSIRTVDTSVAKPNGNSCFIVATASKNGVKSSGNNPKISLKSNECCHYP